MVNAAVVIVLRGILLWIVVPASIVIWLVFLPVRLVRRLAGKRHPSLLAYLRWADDVLQNLLDIVVPGSPPPVRWPRWPRYGDRRDWSPIVDAL
jgi:hypothetical protein